MKMLQKWLYSFVFVSALFPLSSVHKFKCNTVKMDTVFEHYNKEDYHFLISGGYRPSKHTMAKYAVSIRTSRSTKFFGDNHFCAGIIISSNLILTAAHCIMDPNRIITRAQRLRVVAGAPNRLRYDVTAVIMMVQRVIPHPRFYRHSRDDLAILRLEEPLPETNDAIKIIPLATVAAVAGMNCSVLGWGQLFYRGPYAAEATYLDLSIFPETYCQEAYGNLFSKGMLCAGNEDDWGMDTCRGDSGGPLICDKKLYGIASWSKKCATPGFPTIFTDVYYYRKWIEASGAKGFICAVLPIIALMLILIMLF